MTFLKYTGLAMMIFACVTSANVASELICMRIKVKAITSAMPKIEIFRDEPPASEPRNSGEPDGFFGDSDPKFDIRSHGMIEAPMPEGTNYNAKD